MKLDALLEGGAGSGRPSGKARPDKNLWFQKRELWLMDMRRERGGDFDLIQTEDEEEGDIFATDRDRNVCFGAWRKDIDQGITFAKPRPLLSVVNPRLTLKQMLTAPPFKRGI